MQQTVLTIGNAAQLVAEPGQDGVLIQADQANTGDIFLGAQNVTADATQTGGVRLPAGVIARVRLGPSDYLWAIAAVAGQLIRVLYPLDDAVIDLDLIGPASGSTVTPQIPAGSTPVTGNQTGSAAAIVATLAGAAGHTTYLQGLTISGLGATAASVIAVTVTGLLGGTWTFYVSVPAGAGVEKLPVFVELTTPMPASAPNTAIAVNVPSFGAGNVGQGVSAYGYQL